MTPSQSHSLQDISDTKIRSSGDSILPYLFLDPLLLAQHTPVRTVLGLQPLEVVHLIKQILDPFILFRNLHLSSALSQKTKKKGTSLRMSLAEV